MFRHITPITKNIIILNVIMYLVSNFVFSDYLYKILPAYYPFSENFHSWQIVTHMFMHAQLHGGVGIMHILFNMFTLWSFGPVLEQLLGDKKFIILYFLSGLGSFVLFNIWNFYEVSQLANQLQTIGVDVAEIFRIADVNYIGSGYMDTKTAEGRELSQKLFGIVRAPMLGASGAIFGVMAAFSTSFPNAKLVFLFIPYPVKAKYILPFIIIVSLYLGFSGSMDGIAHFAHIGGAITGFLLSRRWRNNRYEME